MAVQCPYCRHALSLKKAKPGRFAPACPKCGRTFELTVFDDPAIKPVAAAIPSERELGASAQGLAAKNPQEQKLASVVTDTVESGVAPSAGDANVTVTMAPGNLPPNLAANVAADLARTVRDQSAAPSTFGETVERARGADLADQGAPVGSDGRVRVAAGSPVSPADARPGAIPAMLGGYQILKELGWGGMGAVYLARQLSLNRNVAIKVMKPEWASNATFVARFTREAYAAAQLTHHNVVQIYDFGEDRGTTYFSMEYVEGQTLGGLVREKSRLDVEEAAGYVLQAARGLKYAHDQSMIHRDIKPENLLLNRQGVVKVADLGLVKTPEVAEADEVASAGKAVPANVPSGGSGPGSGQITLANAAIGTPSYMAPEQAKDAAHVDARADIYSLGCTLYVLVTGRPPFEGRSVLEILSKHQTQPITPPDVVVKRVPKTLSTIILKMVAKKPEDRYVNAGEVIHALEGFLGVSSSGPFTPREEHANVLEECARAYHSSSSARLRSMAVPLVLGVSFALALLFLLTVHPILASAFVSLGLLTALADFVIAGTTQRTVLFLKFRELVLGSRVSEWLTALAGLAIFAVLLLVLKLFWVWVGLGLLAIGIAVALHAALDRRTASERIAPLEQVEAMLRTLRLQGLDEDSIRQFVCKYSGAHWEEFYEALFGYDAKLEARQRWGRGERSSARPKFAMWRDPIASWLDAKIAARRAASEEAKLQKVEEKSLQSQGENLVTARRKAQRAALAMVATAAEIKECIRTRDDTFMVNRAIAQAMREATVKPEKVLIGHERGRLADRERVGLLARLANLVLGPKVRFLAGAALLAGCIAWMHQNAMISSDQAEAVVAAAKTGDVKAIQSHAQSGVARARKVAARETRPLEFPMVPAEVLKLVSSFGAGVGGLILIVSSLFRGVRIALFAVPAAAIPILGPRLGLPAFGELDPSLAPSIVGAGLMAAGMLLGRSRR